MEVRTNSQVVEIRDLSVVLKDGTAYGFSYLVGADGYSSMVRRHLGLKMQKRLIGFHDWLNDRKIDPGDARLESYPIAYDYRGVKFDNTFLVGEAAGLASGFTGEGIYQSLVSGQEVARMILDPMHKTDKLDLVLKYNRVLERVMALFRWAGPLRGALQESLVILMNKEWLRKKVNAQFSR